MYDVIIIGAGPAGLTAGYELSKSNKKVLILEKKHQVGGLAETKVFGNYRYDIGPHRFFTKNEEVYQLFLKMLGDDAVKVDRKTRILFKNSYFDYPLSPLNALFGLGLFESIQIGFSYIYARIKGYLRLSKIENFEDWVVDKFGRKLYSNFFKNYTEKVWGIDCKQIGKDWAAQRIKGLSLTTALYFSLFPNSKKKPKTLIDVFYYPRLGAGMLWEKFEDYLNTNGVSVQKNSFVTNVKEEEDYQILTYIEDGDEKIISAKHILFSNPLLDFIKFYEEEIPDKVISSANNLEYRNHISVHLTVDTKLFDDNWIYIHSPGLKMARIADFTNFSEEMGKENEYPLTLEYFCFEEDDIWSQENNEIIAFALEELKTIFSLDFKVLHNEVTRNSKAYPVIKTGYEKDINIIKNWLKTKEHLTAIGRSGMFKYNNQDHAMATGLYAVRTLLGEGNFDPWSVNVDGEYHEEISSD
jgi:protoporphyrinogen oxidase